MMAGGYNRRNPAVKRIMHEVEELKEATEDYYAQPLEDNLFEWHFTIRGPTNTDFEGGIYHGRISLPSDYPMRPPSIVMMNATGRFTVNTKICLSISGHHPETWQPSWSIRTALLALISFMPTHGLGALGSLDYSPAERQELAKKSQKWECRECGSIANLLNPDPDQSSSDELVKSIETPGGLPNQVLDLEEKANMHNKVITATSTNEVKLENTQEETLIDSITEVHTVPGMDDKNHKTGAVLCASSGNDENDAVQNDCIIIDDCPMQHCNQDHPDSDGKRQSDVDLISGTKSLMQGEERDFEMKGDTIPLPGRKYHPSLESVTTSEHSMQEGRFDTESVDSDAESSLHDKQKVRIDGVQKVRGADDEQQINLNDDYDSGSPSTASASCSMKQILLAADLFQDNSKGILKNAESKGGDPSESQVVHQSNAENDDHADNLVHPPNNNWWWQQYGPMIIDAVLYGFFCVVISYFIDWLFPFLTDL